MTVYLNNITHPQRLYFSFHKKTHLKLIYSQFHPIGGSVYMNCSPVMPTLDDNLYIELHLHMYVASLFLAKTLEVTSGEKNDNPLTGTCTRFAYNGLKKQEVQIEHYHTSIELKLNPLIRSLRLLLTKIRSFCPLP